MSRDLDFERPVLELEQKIEELRRLAAGRDRLAGVAASAPHEDEDDDPRARKSSRSKRPKKEESLLDSAALKKQIDALEDRARKLKEQIFSSLSRWQIVQIARHPQRPYTLDYIKHAFSDFVELKGDRHLSDDASIVGGFARLRGETVMVIGHQKGRTTNENLTRNFGMPRPEGYHKAMRLMRLADQFKKPIITLIDTPGAYPGIDAEERGQARAIAEALEGMAALGTPVVSVVIGEGGSGGALAIGVANRVLMLEYSIYSVISPEGCASILFKDASFAERAADALKLSANDLLELGVIDEIVKEGLGGAHRDHERTAQRVSDAIFRHLLELKKMSSEELRDDRYRRFRFIGSSEEAKAIALRDTEVEEPEPPPPPPPRGSSRPRKTEDDDPAEEANLAPSSSDDVVMLAPAEGEV
jgi:acetyl-CoA carboxylase carboxyl transferase subunit alpha